MLEELAFGSPSKTPPPAGRAFAVSPPLRSRSIKSPNGSNFAGFRGAVSSPIGSGKSAGVAGGRGAGEAFAAAAGDGVRPDKRSANGSSASFCASAPRPMPAGNSSRRDVFPDLPTSLTVNSKLPMCNLSPFASGASFPQPSDMPLCDNGLLPRSMMKKSPLRETTCACTRDTVRSGSSSTSKLALARPMLPPLSSNSADSPPRADPPRMLTTAIFIIQSIQKVWGQRNHQRNHFSQDEWRL